MKKKLIAATLVLPLLSLVGCKKDFTQDDVKNYITTGTWHVSFYSVNANASFAFDDYDFTFSENGNLNIHKSGTNINGTWMLSEIDKETVLDISAGHTSPFDELSNDWEVDDAKPTRIETENNDNGVSSYLTFEKN